MVAAKRVVGDRVKGPARDSASVIGTAQRANTAYYLACGTAGEGEEQYSLGRHAALEKNIDSGGQRRGLTGTRSGDDSKRPIPKSGRFALPRVEFRVRVEHVFDSIFRV